MSSISYKEAVAFSAPNVVVQKPVYNPEKDMFPQTMYERCISNTMTMLRPSSSTYHYRLLQTLYVDSPLRFTMSSALHQNHETDIMHFTVRVQLENCAMNIHLNGFLKTFFIVTTITLLEKGEELTIADFRRKDSDGASV